ncbi:phage tail protein [Clostridia bacterium]|nr:phage tail protein [Clostridia bacterium]
MAMVYPFKKYNYELQIDGVKVAGFSEVSSPDITVDPLELREGNCPANSPGEQPGLVKYGHATLKWGLTTDTSLYKWLNAVESGGADIAAIQKTVVISLHDDKRREIAKWMIVNAWPTRYTAPDLNATSNEVAVEQLELVHEGITRIL